MAQKWEGVWELTIIGITGLGWSNFVRFCGMNGFKHSVIAAQIYFQI